MSKEDKDMQKEASDKSRETLAAWSQEKPDKDDITVIITEEDYEPENLARVSMTEEIEEEKKKIYDFGGSDLPKSDKEPSKDGPSARQTNAHEAGHPDSLSEKPDDGAPTAHDINDHIATAREHYEERIENETPPANDDNLLYQDK